jgi:ankyrin repeat protein
MDFTLEFEKTLKDVSPKTICNLLYIACKEGFLSLVILLLKDNMDLIDTADYEGLTPLFHAYLNDKIEVVEFLLKKGANMYIKDNNKKSILYHAHNDKNQSMIDLFHKTQKIRDQKLLKLETDNTIKPLLQEMIVSTVSLMKKLEVSGE